MTCHPGWQTSAKRGHSVPTGGMGQLVGPCDSRHTFQAHGSASLTHATQKLLIDRLLRYMLL